MKKILNSPVGERIGLSIIAAIYTFTMIIMAYYAAHT